MDKKEFYKNIMEETIDPLKIFYCWIRIKLSKDTNKENEK